MLIDESKTVTLKRFLSDLPVNIELGDVKYSILDDGD